MPQNITKVVIIGGGLTGLTLSYLLNKKGINTIILEARNRLGGRINTVERSNGAPIEMGATWFGRNHDKFYSLLEELNVGFFEQNLSDQAIYEPISTSPPQLVSLPPNNDPSFRIKDGTSNIIEVLANKIGSGNIVLDQVVTSIHSKKNILNIRTETESFQANLAVSTLPPYLLNKSIEFTPSLTEAFYEISNNTHTWMSESIKIGLRYKYPFWREKSSGTIFSNVGPIPEMYDHSNYEDNLFALKGFLNSAYSSVSKEQRIDVIMNQLTKYYGFQAKDFMSYEEVVWDKEPFTHRQYANDLIPHQNNGNAIFSNRYLDGKLFLAGSETSFDYPGYMEGAVRSAIFVCNQITNLINH